MYRSFHAARRERQVHKVESAFETVTDRMDVMTGVHLPRIQLGKLLRSMLLGWVLPLLVVLVVIQLFVYRATSVPGFASRPPGGMQDLSSETDLQARFAQDIGHPRLLLLISPT